MRKLLSLETIAEAYLVQGRLESQGILSEVRGEGPHVHIAELPSVWIARDEDYSRALELTRASAPTTGWPWTCAHCGESIESSLDACWSCGTPRGESSAATE